MPLIGETRRGNEIGKRPYETYIWSACLDCDKRRWVKVRQGKPENQRCVSCSQGTPEARQKKSIAFRGNKSHFWKGGRSRHSGGYILIKLEPDDFFYAMAESNGYVLEHRLVVAKALGRCLHIWEIVHHKGAKYPKGSIENKQDNRYPENLQLASDTRHNQITILERRILYLENKLANCEKEAQEKVREIFEEIESHNMRVETGITDGKRWFKHNDGIWLNNEVWQALKQKRLATQMVTIEGDNSGYKGN